MIFWIYNSSSNLPPIENLISPIHHTLIPDILPLDDTLTLLFRLEHHIISALCGTSDTTRNIVLCMAFDCLGKQKIVMQHMWIEWVVTL